jgi:hypothetical protein
MDPRPSVPVWLLLLGGLALFLTLWWANRQSRLAVAKDRVRRGTGHAMLGLREFIEPSVDYIFQAENLEHRDQDDLDSSTTDREEILADLAASLGRDPVDREEVRRHLASARRAGLDWREVYERALQDELSARPYRIPRLPPIGKVAPRE